MTVRVRLISPLPPPAGGIARWTKLVTEYARVDNSVTVAVLNTALRWRSAARSEAWIRILAGIPQIFECCSSLLISLIRRQADVVHINCSGQFGMLRDLALAALSRLFGVPVIVHLRFGRVPSILASGGYERRLLRTLLAASSATIAIDSKTEAALRAAIPDLSLELIPNCADAPQWLPRSETASLGNFVLFAGRLISAKGVPELLAAWRALPPNDWNLVLAGGFDAAYLKSLGLRVGENSDIIVLGEIDHGRLMSLMANCEIFVLPSHTEGFPNAVLEAMTFGRPVISCDVGAVGDMLAGECGCIVPVQSPPDIRETIAKLMGDPEKRRHIGSNAANKAKSEYSLPTAFARYHALWSRLARFR